MFKLVPKKQFLSGILALALVSSFLLVAFTVHADGAATTPTTPAAIVSIPSLGINIPGLSLSVAKDCEAGFLCIPWLSQYLVGLYNYAIGIVGILASVTIMYGGFLWVLAAGDPSKVKEARAWISNSIVGVIIALCSYTIMYQVNPDLTSFKYLKILKVKDKAITPFSLQFEVDSDGKGTCKTADTCPENYAEVEDKDKYCTDTDPVKPCCCLKKASNISAEKPVVGVGKCQASATGNCSVEKLKDTCFADKAEQASAICNGESGGGNVSIASGVDYCCGDNYDANLTTTNSKGVTMKIGCTSQYRKPVSFGLFQVNIASGDKVGGLPCIQAFSKPYTGGSSRNCKVINESLYISCVNAAKDPTINIDTACQIQRQGTWKRWGYFKNVCGGNFNH